MSKTRLRKPRTEPTAVELMADKPFQQTRNPYPPLNPLSTTQLGQIHEASMRIVEEIGLDFLDAEALDIWEKAGAKVDHTTQHVWIDRHLLMEAVSLAPASFTLRAPNPARALTMGGNAINFCTVGGAPFYSDLERGRRPGELADYARMAKLAHMCGPIHMVEGLMVEPQDIPVPVRHLEKAWLQYTLTDKAITAASHGRDVAEDYVQMAAIVHGGLAAIQQTPAFASVVNVNSPLRYDDRMLGGLLTYARHAQPVIVTPFILAGAMSPVSVASAVAQQNAEALAGIALMQLVRAGCPAMYGGFATNLDLRTGAPAFGTPEGALALLMGGQLARHYGLPFRGSGGLNNSKVVDAQAAVETQMSLWPVVMSHANVSLHCAGWLEAGLVCSMEKFMVDVEGLAMMQRFLQGVSITDETLALDEIAAVGPGGHHLGTDYTLERFRTAFYMPLLADRQNYEGWRLAGAEDAAVRAHKLAQKLITEYEAPPLDPAVREELAAFIGRRKTELLK